MVTWYFLCFFFFFSSRRRHTRLQGDWSSDVCSSDLLMTCYLLISIIVFMLLMYEVVTNSDNLLALASVPWPCLQYNIYNVHIFYATINSLTVVYFPMLSTFLCTHTRRPMNLFDLCVYPGRHCDSMHYY